MCTVSATYMFVYYINSVEAVSSQFIVQECMARAWGLLKLKVKLDILVPLEFVKHPPFHIFPPV